MEKKEEAFEEGNGEVKKRSIEKYINYRKWCKEERKKYEGGGRKEKRDKN